MNELKPCPFCGGKVEHQLMFDGAYSFTCSECGLNARFADDIARAVPDALEETERMWNTRYERTCHIVEKHGYFDGLVVRDLQLSCGCHVTAADVVKYCPRCGAKVVEE